MSRHTIPELGTGSREGVIRLPEATNANLTPRVLAIIDHPAFQRLRNVRQLGPTHLVYPGAVHTRFEHSIGVYDTTGLVIAHLLDTPAFADAVSEEDILTVLAAALLHDLGHYSMAHSLEALHLKGNDTPRHEDVAAAIVRGEVGPWVGHRPISEILRQTWGVDSERVIRLFTVSPRRQTDPTDRLLASIISGGIDADKMDYLERDSVHMGVPYGRNYDRARLLDSLTLSTDMQGLAVTAKGRTSAELFIFCRYAMFAEAYWHHTVRSVSAMVEAAIGDLQAKSVMPEDTAELTLELLARSDDQVLEWLLSLAPDDSAAHRLLRGLALGHRRIYKRLLTVNRRSNPRFANAHSNLIKLDADGIRALTSTMRRALSSHFAVEIPEGDLIIDTPPRDKDKVETIEVRSPELPPSTLSEVSSVVRGIAEDFVGVVKRTRIFIAPEHRAVLERPAEAEELLLDLACGAAPSQ